MSIADKFEGLSKARTEAERQKLREIDEFAKAAIERAEKLHLDLEGEAEFFEAKGLSIELDGSFVFLSHDRFVIGCNCKNSPISILLGRRDRRSGSYQFDSLSEHRANDFAEAQIVIAELMDKGFHPDGEMSMFVSLEEIR